MGDLLIAFLLFLFIVISSSKKKKTKKAAPQPSRATVKPAQPHSQQPTPNMHKFYKGRFALDDSAFKDGVQISMPDMDELPVPESMGTPEDSLHTRATIQVKTTVAPHVKTRVAVTADKDVYRGSMDATSLEGEDPDHDHTIGVDIQSVTPSVSVQETPGWTPDLTPSAMMNAIVMSEVLGRPVSRRK